MSHLHGNAHVQYPTKPAGSPESLDDVDHSMHYLPGSRHAGTAHATIPRAGHRHRFRGHCCPAHPLPLAGIRCRHEQQPGIQPGWHAGNHWIQYSWSLDLSATSPANNHAGSENKRDGKMKCLDAGSTFLQSRKNIDR